MVQRTGVKIANLRPHKIYLHDQKTDPYVGFLALKKTAIRGRVCLNCHEISSCAKAKEGLVMVKIVSTLVGFDVVGFERLLRRIVARLVRYYVDKDNFNQKGVYVCLLGGDGVPKVVFEVRPEGGQPFDLGEPSLYSYLAMEKPRRLWLHTKYRHISSRQSRDPSKHQFAGGVDADRSHLLVGVSGFTEDGDEAVALLACLELGLMSVERARTIADIGAGNALFHDFWKVWRAEKSGVTPA